MGDFNINLLKHDNQSRELSQLTTDHNFSQLIKESTRVTTNASTLIDHLYTNRPQFNLNSGVIRCSLSDHDVIYTCRKKPPATKSTIKTVEMRTFKNTDYDAIRKMVKEAPWWIFEHCQTIDKKYEMFLEILKHVLNTHAPLKTIRIKQCRKIWMTAEYNKMTRVARKAKRKFSKIRTEEAFEDYKKLRNKLNFLKIKLKRNVIKNIAQDPKDSNNLGHFEHTCWQTENGNCYS